ncbi:MAG TPA: M48 family metallopeptidase [Acidiferrobacterales bacterium]|nr:M48 family metallopeptidase [Acidiferrobacterales bacterium]
MSTALFTQIFLILLTGTLLTRLWLARRHIRHVLGHRRQVPAAFRGKILLKAHRKAADYTVAKTRFAMVAGVIDALLLLGWTLGGGLEFLDQGWRAAGFGELVTGTLFLLSVFLIIGLLDLPATVYQTFVIEQRFGFNHSTPALFVADLLKQALLLLVIGAPLALAALWLMQSAGTLWWFYLWLLWSGFTLLMIWAYPAVIAPLFNKFTPLKNRSVQTRIQALLRRTGFRSRGIFVMDGSRRSAHGNAYFTGFGRNKRVVFFDTLLKTLRGPEIEAVLAHELGHFHHRHILKRIIMLFGMSLAGLALLGWLILQPWFYQGLGVSTASAHAALILFLMAGPVFSFFLQPLMAWGSRRHEYQADVYAADQADIKPMISALVKLYRENASTLTPDPVYSAFYDSHPPASLRIAHLQSLA